MKKKFEILQGLPTYGEMYISIPENGYSEFSEGLAVKFVRNDGTEWVGNFETGNSSLKFGAELKNSEDILIISCGYCYIINPEVTRPKIRFGLDYREVFEYKSLFILIGEYSISIVENIERIKHFEHICFEGIENVELQDGILKGILNEFNQSKKENDKSNFTINLETLEFKEIPIIEEKKWWKIW